MANQARQRARGRPKNAWRETVIKEEDATGLHIYSHVVGMPAKQKLDKKRNGRKALMPYATSIIEVGIHVTCICTSGTQNVPFF